MWESAACTEYGQSSMDIQFQCGQDLNPADCTYGTCSCRLEDQTQCLPTYGAGTGPVWLSDVGCTGSETSLCECKQGSTNASVSWTAGLYSCNNDHKNDAGVECLGVQTLPPARIKDCDDVCVPKSRLGDGWCDDGQFDANFNCMQLSCDATSNVTGSTSDCHMKTCAPAPEQCPAGKWRCDDGSKCIDGAQRCDNVPQCADKSDESLCSGVFCCNDGTKCIPLEWRNDEWPDCLDGSDESLQKFNTFHYNLKNP
jgi:hypothetical protein